MMTRPVLPGPMSEAYRKLTCGNTFFPQPFVFTEPGHGGSEFHE
jgi:hypothetical protein